VLIIPPSNEKNNNFLKKNIEKQQQTPILTVIQKSTFCSRNYKIESALKKIDLRQQTGLVQLSFITMVQDFFDFRARCVKYITVEKSKRSFTILIKDDWCNPAR